MSWEDVTIGGCRLIHGRAEDVLPTLPDASVSLICTDPPYMGVKLHHNGARVEWDRQWPTREAYLTWLRELALEWRRILKPNGSLYCFAAPQMAAHVEVMLGEVFHVLQRITWAKPPFATKAEMFDKESCRMYFPASEAILFCEQYASDEVAMGEAGYDEAERTLKTSLFSAPILEAMHGTGTTAKDVTDAIGAYGKVNHGGAVSNWLQGYNIPTKAHYEAMRQFFTTRNCRSDYLRREYEDLRREYEDLRREYEDLRREYEDLRRPFTVSPSVPYTDVWHFPTVQAYAGKHACEKPLSLYRHIVMASSRSGDMCLDCCAGSFAFLDAARQCGRQGIGIEPDRHWWQHGCQRLSQADLFAQAVAPAKPVPPQQLTLT